MKLQLEQVLEKRRRQEDLDELPLTALNQLPEAIEGLILSGFFSAEDAPAGHMAHTAVCWEGSSGAFFYFKGTKFQVTQAFSGSQAAAMLLARACYVKLSAGASQDEARRLEKRR